MSVSTAGFMVAVLGVVWSIYRMHLNPENQFNVLDCLMENGRASRIAFIVMGAFMTHSWIMIDLESKAKMSEGYLTIYGATWVAPLLAKLFMSNKA